MTKERKQIGSKGESRAITFLVDHNYKILDQNLRFSFGEIDILAEDQDGAIVIVEVKTKISDDITEPYEAVTEHKKHRLLRLARAIEASYSDRPIRIDVISIVEDKIEHIENAVWQS